MRGGYCLKRVRRSTMERHYGSACAPPRKPYDGTPEGCKRETRYTGRADITCFACLSWSLWRLTYSNADRRGCGIFHTD